MKLINRHINHAKRSLQLAQSHSVKTLSHEVLSQSHLKRTLSSLGLYLVITFAFHSLVQAQTPILRQAPKLPSEYKIDLEKPPKGKDAKKKWKDSKKQEKDQLKALNKHLDGRLDSLDQLREKDGRKQSLKSQLVRLGDIDGLDIPHKEKVKRHAKNKPDSSAIVSLLDEYSGAEAGSRYANIQRFAVYKDSVSVLTEDDSVRQSFIHALAGNNQYFQHYENAEAAKDGQADSVAMQYATGGQDLDQYLASKTLSSEQNGALSESQMTKEDLVPSMDEYFAQYGIDPQNLSYNDKEQVKGKVDKLAKSQYKNHFAGKEDQLLKAQSKLGKVKKKRSFGEVLAYLFDQDQESMKKKDLKDRFYLGGYLQYLRGDPDILDLSPVVGYRLTSKITLGLGGTYRKTFGESDTTLVSTISEDVLGYRTYMDYQFIYGLYLHTEFESLRTKVLQTGRQVGIPTENIRRAEWVNGFLFGIGRDFKITGKLSGSAQVLYNFSHDKDRTPYPKPWVFRFGFKYN